ncbi:NYN domain-containing protein [Rhodococcus tibetensis]|uniref:NYN domain-containing protein n=1 Tax=Rhodococcus tibetensis TaxID=2965064 RepID=A0ABT1QA05_9NOCA|nr:NYN domain-containing protein [Rhodococcus sp. FXJ9.536]MCQ4119078.1 NYN domain-containing protein [Rhodococcus sp. FXJ9.536]
MLESLPVTNDRGQLIVVDAANVVGARPDGWWRDRAGAARRLLAQLIKLDESLDRPTEVIVVLEGAARTAVADETDPTSVHLRVVRADGSGDDAIVAEVADAAGADSNRPIIVVTADRGLRERVEALGAGTVGPRWLLERIEVPGTQ